MPGAGVVAAAVRAGAVVVVAVVGRWPRRCSAGRSDARPRRTGRRRPPRVVVVIADALSPARRCSAGRSGAPPRRTGRRRPRRCRPRRRRSSSWSSCPVVEAAGSETTGAGSNPPRPVAAASPPAPSTAALSTANRSFVIALSSSFRSLQRGCPPPPQQPASPRQSLGKAFRSVCQEALGRGVSATLADATAHSSSGLGHRPLTAAARVRIPYGPSLRSPRIRSPNGVSHGLHRLRTIERLR